MLKHILLIGGDSRLARHFVQTYGDQFSLEITTRSGDASYRLDLAENPELWTLPQEIEAIVIFASLTNILECEKNPSLAYQINVNGISRLIDRINSSKVRCLYLSTSCVFSMTSYDLSEYGKLKPETIYGQTKKSAEEIVLLSPNNAVLRMSKIFGLPSILNDWKSALSLNQHVNAFENLRVAPLHISYASKAIYDWLVNPYCGISHVSTSTDLTYYELACHLAASNGYSLKYVNPIDVASQHHLSLVYLPTAANLLCTMARSTCVPIEYSLRKLIAM